jgi:hypothetical protein
MAQMSSNELVVKPDIDLREERFGSALLLDGNRLFVGSPIDTDTLGSGSSTPLVRAGSVSFYEKQNGVWQFKQKILSSDREADDFLGQNIALVGNHLLVTAHEEGSKFAGNDTVDDAGAVYSFSYNGTEWVQTQKITPAKRMAGEYFGKHLEVQGDTAFISATAYSDTINTFYYRSLGRVYVFVKNSSGIWNEVQQILPPVFDSWIQFGSGISVDGDYAVFGGSSPSGGGTGSSVDIFKRDSNKTWQYDTTISGNDTVNIRSFGWSFNLHKNFLMVGSESDETSVQWNYTQSGRAYLFKRDNSGNWTQVQTIVNPNISQADFFSSAIDFNSNFAVIGSKLEDEDVQGLNYLAESGAVYVYPRSPQNGLLGNPEKIVSSDRIDQGNFGATVAIDGNQFAVGAPTFKRTNPYVSTGRVYTYDLQAPSSVNEQETAKSFELFPNPGSNWIFKNYKDWNLDRIIDMQGRSVKYVEIDDKVFIDAAQNQIYQIRFENPEGDQIWKKWVSMKQ